MKNLTKVIKKTNIIKETPQFAENNLCKKHEYEKAYFLTIETMSCQESPGFAVQAS